MSARSRTPLVVGVVLAVVAVLAVGAVLATRGDDDEAAPGSEVTAGGASPGPTADAGGAGDGGTAVGAAVQVDGAELPRGDGPSDPAIGSVAPTLSGSDFSGAPVEIAPGADGPLLVVFLAHWCPHCNAEIPVLQEWEARGGIPDDLRVVGVSTSARPEAPNYPPDEWLADRGWAWPVLEDDDEATAAVAFGVSGFPYLAFLDADGQVVARTAGEVPIETLQTLADAAVA